MSWLSTIRVAGNRYYVMYGYSFDFESSVSLSPFGKARLNKEVECTC